MGATFAKKIQYEPLVTANGGRGDQSDTSFLCTLAFLELIIVLYYVFNTELNGVAETQSLERMSLDTIHLYAMFQNIHVMIFIGFGFLMTFLKKNAFGAVAHTLLIGVFSIQAGIMWVHLMSKGFWEDGDKKLLDIEALIKGDFAAAATLISFGALIGRVTPTQLLWMLFSELFFYGINYRLVTDEFQAKDTGCSMTVHIFGAYFGLAFSYMLGTPSNINDEGSVYHSDVFSMIGTVFLWCYWPSFNAVLVDPTTWGQERAIVVTLISLVSSCVATFFVSNILCGKFDMVHIQNATLAGGVAVGTACNMVLVPWIPVVIGAIAGTISTAGYVYGTPALNARGIYDVCGINNLHGMPGLLGGVLGIFIAASASSDGYHAFLNGPEKTDYFFFDTASNRALAQTYAVLSSLIVGVFGGLLTGFVITRTTKAKLTPFSDEDDFIVPTEEYVGNYFRVGKEQPEYRIEQDYGSFEPQTNQHLL